MLIEIGSTEESSDVVDLLLACHQRIRFFIDLALQLSHAMTASPDEVRGASARVLRYFEEALPLHVQDEEESILPRLRGKQPIIDKTLDVMCRDHVVHQVRLVELLQICQLLQREPEQLSMLREDLGAVASGLVGDFNAHLSEEEATILPAIQSLLTDADRQAILQELRMRRIK